MFDIHLSWSPILLVVMLLIDVVFCVLFITHAKVKVWKALVGFVASVILTFFLAFDAGTRQADLGRQSFNQDLPTVETKKVESNRTNAKETKQSFEQAVKQTEGMK